MMSKPQVGVGVLIFNANGQVLLGKRMASHGQSTWGPVGGHLEYHETFEECAMREVFEETGLQILNPLFLAVTNDFFILENKHYVSIFMQARLPEGQEIETLEPHKIAQWSWFNFSDLPNNLFLPLQNLINQRGYGFEREN